MVRSAGRLVAEFERDDSEVCALASIATSAGSSKAQEVRIRFMVPPRCRGVVPGRSGSIARIRTFEQSIAAYSPCPFLTILLPSIAPSPNRCQQYDEKTRLDE